MTGNLHLHDDDVFALDIDLLRFASPAMGQTQNPMIRLFFLMYMYKSSLPEKKKHNEFLPVLSVLCLFAFV